MAHHTGSLTLLLASLAPAGSAAAAPAPDAGVAWDAQYTARALPQKSGWGANEGANTTAEIVDGALRIVDAGTAKGELHCYSTGWGIDPARGGIVEARVKGVSCSGRAGMGILIADGVHEEFLHFYPDRIELGNCGLTYALDTTTAFHTYRVTLLGEDIRVDVDGKTVLDGAGKFATPAHKATAESPGRLILLFGSLSSAATGEAHWEWVRYSIRRPQVTRVPGAEDVVIYKQPDIYACFPGLVPMENGDLVTSFGTRVHRSHIDSTGGGARRISHDGGRTWEEFTGEIVDPMCRAADGSLAAAGATGWKHVPAAQRADLEARGVEIHTVPTKADTIAHAANGAFFRRSTDGGKSWQRAEIAVPQHALLMAYNRAAALRTRKGVRLVAVYGRLKRTDPGETFVLRSEDDGKTWEFLPLARDPEGKLYFNETALVENTEGEIIAMIRSEPPAGGTLYQSVSRDAGKTWSAPVKTEIWGYPAHLLLLRDGRLLCSYGYRRDAMGVRAVLSRDGGKTWDTRGEMVIRGDGVGSGSDLGYPLTTQLADGTLFTLYYITNGDGITHVAGTRWPAPKP